MFGVRGGKQDMAVEMYFWALNNKCTLKRHPTKKGLDKEG